jgi:4-amino-4-deoxy-L-arabinose transferase-like glycosyltransferase
VRLALAALVPPLGDEAYHWHLGSQFHLSYDHPPLAYWLAALGPCLAPTASFLLARLPFVLLFSGSTWLMFLLGRRVGGGWAGVHAALLFSAAPYFLAGAGTAALPEGPLIFTWLLCLWLLARLFLDPQPERPKLLWLALGLALGAAFLSKYHALFIPLGVALFLMMKPAARRRASGVGPLIALISAAIVSLPVIVWNHAHGFASFTLYLHRGVAVRGLHPEEALVNLAGQALLLMPWTWALLVGCLVRGLTRGPHPPAARLLSALAVGPLILFTALSALNGEWDQFHWPLVAYASLFPLAGAAQAAAVERAAGWPRRRTVLSMASIVAVPAGILLYAATSWGPRLFEVIPVEAPSPWMARNYDFSGYAGLDEALDHRGLLHRSNLFVCAELHGLRKARLGPARPTAGGLRGALVRGQELRVLAPGVWLARSRRPARLAHRRRCPGSRVHSPALLEDHAPGLGVCRAQQPPDAPRAPPARRPVATAAV